MSSSTKTFRVRLTMESDWHVGTGAGRPGSVDKLIARDADGFPFVPAKTLNGIWRDAMEVLTLGLDGGTKNEWQKFVEAIFGNQPALTGADPTIKPFSSILKVQPARLNETLQKKIKSLDKTNKQKFFVALTFIKPGVAIDEHSGTAKPDFLRFEEMGRSGTVLEADCELSYCDETIWALLVASARLVERIGGKRRRGAGKCKLVVLDENDKEPNLQTEIENIKKVTANLSQKFEDVKTAIEQLKNFDKQEADESEGETQNQELPGQEEETDSTDSPKNAWLRLEYSLTLKTPVSIVTATLGNVSESLDFIPGTYLLPHFTKVLGKQLGKEFFTAVAYGDFQVSPATIDINQERGLPVPKVLGLKKVGGSFEKPNTVFNTFHDEKPNNEQIKNLREGYIGNFCFSLKGNGKLPTYKKTPKTLLMHNVIEDKVQRPTEEVGGVFSREAIAAETTLRGEIRLKKLLAEKLDEKWHEKLSGNVRLGTSRKDDYGLAKLKILSEPKEIDSQFPFNLDELTVYLLSDVLLRNSNLRQTNLVEDLAKAICQKLNEGIRDESQKGCLRATKSLIQTRRIESWHEGWGFPRPTLIAMAAGSCVMFQVTNGSLSLEVLKKLEAEGIGERRGEGYGQVRFNPPLLTQKINAWKPAEESKNKADKPTDVELENDAFVEQVELAFWREEIKIAVLKTATDKCSRKDIFGFEIKEDEKGNKTGKPQMSQIGSLRSVISRLQSNSQDNKAIVLGWLKHLRATPNRRDKWSAEALDSIEKLIEYDSVVWETLKLESLPKLATKPSKHHPIKDWQKEFWAEAVRSLFDACARAHKRELEKKGGN